MSEEFSQYRRMAADLAGPALEAGRDADMDIAANAAARVVLTGAVDLDQGLGGGLKYLAAAVEAGPSEVPGLRDGSGDRRDIYFPFALHLNLTAFGKRYESMDPRQWGGCEESISRVVGWVEGAVSGYTNQSPPAGVGPLVLWLTVCLVERGLLMGRDTDLELADVVVHRVLASAGQAGALHPQEDTMEAWTYRELYGLHALAWLALLRRNDQWAARVREVAGHHLEHTQPDHVTSQPWGLFAFAWSHNTRPFADQQLHDVASYAQADSEGGARRVPSFSAMLLADAAAAFDLFKSN